MKLLTFLVFGFTCTIAKGDKARVLVKTKNSKGTTFAHSLAQTINMEIKRERITSITIDANNMNALKRNKHIEMVELVHNVEIDDPVTAENNGIRKVGEKIPYGISMVLQHAENSEFWDTLTPNGTVKVCVADTGYNLGHVDLPTGNDVTGSKNSYIEENWAHDGNGHGTHCAGTVAAIGKNEKGVAGVIPNNKGGSFQLIIGKALDENGEGSTDGVLNAVETCVANGANVISLSLGCSNCFGLITEEYYKNLYNDGILLVAAAGNNGSFSKLYPASYSSVISVAAVDSSENRASFSQFNDQVEISGPGVDVKSTYLGNTYRKESGTSMATPHVAAVAGILWMQFPDCENYQIRNALDKTAKNLGSSSGCDIRTGHGLVQAKDAYDLLSQGNCGGDIGASTPVGGCLQLSEPKCVNNIDCDDSDACTSDTCVNDYCVNEMLPCDQCGLVARVKVEITTDSYPHETTWQIKGDSILMSGGPYSDGNYNFSVSQCFDSGSYSFIIFDSYKDGICCAHGEGSYQVSIDGNEVVPGRIFTDSEEKNFEIFAPSLTPSTYLSTTPTSTYNPPTPTSTYNPPTPTSTYNPPTPTSTYNPPTPTSTYNPPTPTSTYNPPTPLPTESHHTTDPITSPLTQYPNGTPPTQYPNGTPPTQYPNGTPPTQYPTGTPPTQYPTGSPPTQYPTGTPPTQYPTGSPPTQYPTGTPPTPFPTRVPPTPAPTQTCKAENDQCRKKRDCCSNRCHNTKKVCKSWSE